MEVSLFDAKSQDLSTMRDLSRVRRLVKSGRAKEIRVQAQISPSEIAERAGVHRITVHRWERGQLPTGEAGLRYLSILDALEAEIGAPGATA